MRPIHGSAQLSSSGPVRAVLVVIALASLLGWTMAGPASATPGRVREFVLTPQSAPSGITVGSDGAFWFAEQYADQIGRITTEGQITEFAIPPCCGQPIRRDQIATGPDGALWFTEFNASAIGRITTDGDVTHWSLGRLTIYPQASSPARRRHLVYRPVRDRPDRHGRDDKSLRAERPIRHRHRHRSGQQPVFHGQLHGPGRADHPERPAADLGRGLAVLSADHRRRPRPAPVVRVRDRRRDRPDHHQRLDHLLPLPSHQEGDFVESIASGPRSGLFFAEFWASRIGRISTR